MVQKCANEEESTEDEIARAIRTQFDQEIDAASLFGRANERWKIKLEEARLLRKGKELDQDLSETRYWDALASMRNGGDHCDDEFVAVALELVDFYVQQSRMFSAVLLMADLVDVFLLRGFEETVSDWTFAPIIKRCVELGLVADADRLSRHALREIDDCDDLKCASTDCKENHAQEFRLNSKMKVVRARHGNSSGVDSVNFRDETASDSGFKSRSSWGSLNLCM